MRNNDQSFFVLWLMKMSLNRKRCECNEMLTSNELRLPMALNLPVAKVTVHLHRAQQKILIYVKMDNTARV
jgi:hypothetical protein